MSDLPVKRGRGRPTKEEAKEIQKLREEAFLKGYSEGDVQTSILRGRCYEMWRSGLNLVEISETLREEGHPVSTQWVRTRVGEAARAIQPEQREIEIVRTSTRYDAYVRAVFDKAAKGDLKAIDRALKIEQARRELLGLDAPKKSEVEVTDTRDNSTIEAEIRAIRERLGIAALPTLDAEWTEDEAPE